MLHFRLYNGDQSPVKMMRDEYLVRRDLICKGLEDLGFVFPVPEGAFYTFVPMKPALTQKIINNGIIIVPGSAFGVNVTGICPGSAMPPQGKTCTGHLKEFRK